MSSALLKKLGGLAAVLILLWAAYLYRQVPHSQIPFDKAGSRAERVILGRGPKKVELYKQGNTWRVVTGPDASSPADEPRVQALLAGLENVQVEDEISNREDRMAEYEVNGDSATLVRLLGVKDVVLAEGYFGKQAPDFLHIYFRYSDKPTTYLARGVPRGELANIEVDSWRNPNKK